MKKASEERQQYRRQRLAYLDTHGVCACHRLLKTLGVKCSAVSSDIHHTRGRAGKLLNEVRYWMPVCRRAHDWIGSNIEASRKLGWICGKGLWNHSSR